MSDLDALQKMLSENAADLEAERLILDATELIIGLMGREDVSRSELAERIGKSKGHISQLLNGERNMTLRTLAELTHALGARVSLSTDIDRGTEVTIADDQAAALSATLIRWLRSTADTQTRWPGGAIGWQPLDPLGLREPLTRAEHGRGTGDPLQDLLTERRSRHRHLRLVSDPGSDSGEALETDREAVLAS